MQSLKPRDTQPDEFRGFLNRLQERSDALPRRLRQVAEHMLAHPDDAAFQTSAKIAEQAGVQPSTLVRFARALDYAGFSDLQQVFRARLKRQNTDHIARLAALREGRAGEGSMARSLLDGFIHASHTSLDALRMLDPAEVDQAATLLAAARNIILVGSRRMFPAVSYLAYAFGKLGLPAVLIDNIASLGAEQALIARQDDAVLAVSFAPYAALTLDITAAAHRRGVPVVAITDSAISPFARQCTQALVVAETDFGEFRSMAATFALAMTLAVATAEKTRSDA